MAAKKKAKKASKAQTRRSRWTPALVGDLLVFLEDGGMISEFCREHQLARSSLNQWRRSDPDLDSRIARAREAGTEVLEEQFAEVTSKPELVVNLGTAKKPKWVAVSDDVPHRKLKAWGLEKRLAWNNVGRYGDKVQVGGAADLPPVVLSESERVARLEALLATANKRRRSKETNGSEEESTGH